MIKSNKKVIRKIRKQNSMHLL